MSLWTVCLRKRLFRIFPDSHFRNYPSEKSNRPGFINMKYVFLSAVYANSLVDRCRVYDH